MRLIKTFHTNQPYIPYYKYEIDGVEVLVRGSHWDQTWDCQPYHAPTCVWQVDGRSPTEEEATRYMDMLIAAGFHSRDNLMG